MADSSLARVARREKTRREILTRSEALQPLPEVVLRALALLNNPDVEASDIEQTLQSDPVVIGKLLSLVNSPLFGVGRQVSSVRDAVMVIGFRGVRSLLLASSTSAYLERDYGCYGHDPSGLLKHSVAVAAAARALATATRQDVQLTERVFVAGLLHDIGKMLVAPYLVERNIAIAGDDRPITVIEKKEIGLDHAEASALVAAKWGLDADVQATLARHHTAPTQDDDADAGIAIVRLADGLAHETGIGYLPDLASPAEFHADDLALLQLEGDAWADARAAAIEAAQVAAAAIGKS